MEKFDLVDINDNVIGETDKETSHTNGDLHRIIAVFVFDSQNKLYVQEHIKSNGRWDHSIGGHVSKGESYDEAAKRESFEELNIISPLKKISVFYSDETSREKNTRHMIGLYESFPPKEWQFIPNEEVQNIFPMDISEIVKLMNSNPEKFTLGFLNTMYEFINIKKLPFKLKKYSVNDH